MNHLYEQIRQLGMKYQFDKIVLFGSRARGDAGEKSDVDLAVFAKDTSDKARFTFDLEDLATLLKFDVVFVDENTDKDFFKNIEKDGIIIMNRYQTKLKNLQNAVERLQEAVEDYAKYSIKSIRDGAIQRFEFTIELAWKTIREHLINQGFSPLDSPKAVMKEAYAHNLLQDEALWIGMLNDRYLTSHLYDDENAQKIFENIVQLYLPALKKLSQFLNECQ